MTRATAASVLALALLVASCAPEKPSMYWGLPAGMVPEQVARFEKNCERWNFVAIQQQYIARDESDVTRRVFFRLPEHMTNGADANGEYIAASQSINVAWDLPLDDFEIVMLHEQGHALGLAPRDHVPAPAVMSANATMAEPGVIALTAGDIEECRRVKACE
jgi:hypothetical protein